MDNANYKEAIDILEKRFGNNQSSYNECYFSMERDEESHASSSLLQV